jgi:hypothetical protein
MRFLPAISAKNVAPISGQAVTLLDKLYLIPSSLARLPRKEVLIPSPVVMGFAQTDIGNLSARIRLPRFASVDYTGFLPEEHTAERNYGHVDRSKGVPNCKQRSAGHGKCRFSFPAVLPEPGVAANEACTYNIHTAPHERRRMSQSWKLVGPDGKPYTSAVPGTLGGHRRNRIYGRLDCPTALRAIERGGYVTHRVFFLTEEHARAAGYRPCAVCLPKAYARWKAQLADGSGSRLVHVGRRRQALRAGEARPVE